VKTILQKLAWVPFFILIISCQQNDLYDEIYRSYNPIHNFDASDTTGDRVTGAYNGVPFCYINAKGADAPDPASFPTGFDNSSKLFTGKFFISETVVTNELFRVVYQWAYDNKKFNSDNSGATNGVGNLDANYGGNGLIQFAGSKVSFDTTNKVFKVESGFEKHPVVNVTGYGAIMFCNWLTEMTGGNEDDMVYTGMDETSWSVSGPNADTLKRGYRLPADDEWEYAARYICKDPPAPQSPPTYVVPINGYWWTEGNCLSGSETRYDASDSTYNDAVAVYGEYWNGSPTGVSSLAAVGSKRPNQLGIYDMSGNVWELCCDYGAVFRLPMRGGSYQSIIDRLRVGDGSDIYSPPSYKLLDEHDVYTGFRVCKTK